jgi:hypothetical protein
MFYTSQEIGMRTSFCNPHSDFMFIYFDTPYLTDEGRNRFAPKQSVLSLNEVLAEAERIRSDAVNVNRDHRTGFSLQKILCSVHTVLYRHSR